jgi:hypothetical protein
MTLAANLGTLNATSAEQRAGEDGSPKLLLYLPSMTHDALETVLKNLASVFAPREVLVATPDLDEDRTGSDTPLPMVKYEAPRRQFDWVLNGSDYLAAANQMEQHSVAAAIVLGPDATTLPASAVRQMADLLASGVDLAVPSYSLAPHEGLVNSALLYPVTRALFAANIRFPLAADVGISGRMAAKLKSAAQRQTASSQPGAFVWVVAEAAVTGLSFRQVEAGLRSMRPPDASDFNVLFAEVAGSLFADIEAKASFWQRARAVATTNRLADSIGGAVDSVDNELPPMIDAFRLAHSNLQEIWSLILPPQSLVALKKLSLSEPSAFSLPSSLWARIVYDFALGFHLRTINRGHLLGAFTPLYLAWVASTLRLTGDTAALAIRTEHTEETALAFERERPYMVARWRWPDRFNP